MLIEDEIQNKLSFLFCPRIKLVLWQVKQEKKKNETKTKMSSLVIKNRLSN